MIHPLVPYTIKGAIWYQGESNVGRADQYKKLFPAMIEDWRNQWGNDFSFYFVQIAPFIYNADPALQISQELRDAQRVTLRTPKTGMAVTLDIGNPTNIHPGNKQDIGLRLARWALAQDYGKDLVPSGPLFKEAKQAGNKIIAYFDYTGTGLIAKQKLLKGFEIAGTDKKYKPASARIVGNTIEASTSAIPEPVFIRYAWRDDSEAYLLNKEGLPASSFSSEN
jgi:sialate O-acetylesterase